MLLKSVKFIIILCYFSERFQLEFSSFFGFSSTLRLKIYSRAPIKSTMSGRMNINERGQFYLRNFKIFSLQFNETLNELRNLSKISQFAFEWEKFFSLYLDFFTFIKLINLTYMRIYQFLREFISLISSVRNSILMNH